MQSIVLTVTLSLVMVLSGGFGLAQASDEEIGVVKTVIGEAGVTRGAEEIAASVGQSLQVGDRISTGADGAVGFTLRDGSRFSVGPNSAIVMSDFQFEPDRGLLGLIARLLYGTMTHATGEIGRVRPESVRIGTPLGQVGVRGTRFAIKQPGAPLPVAQ